MSIYTIINDFIRNHPIWIVLPLFIYAIYLKFLNGMMSELLDRLVEEIEDVENQRNFYLEKIIDIVSIIEGRSDE